jgi:hypothetical protein
MGPYHLHLTEPTCPCRCSVVAPRKSSWGGAVLPRVFLLPFRVSSARWALSFILLFFSAAGFLLFFSASIFLSWCVRLVVCRFRLLKLALLLVLLLEGLLIFPVPLLSPMEGNHVAPGDRGLPQPPAGPARHRAVLDERNQHGGHGGIDDGALRRSAAGVGVGGKRESVSVAEGTAMVLAAPLILSPWPGAAPGAARWRSSGPPLF